MEYVNLKKFEAVRPVAARVSSKERFLFVGGVVLVFCATFLYFFGGKVRALFDPISIVANITGSNLKQSDGRTNILLLGSDKRDNGSVVTSILTDTILVVSIGKVNNDVVLISIPRDLWVESPQGYQSKINSIYANGGAEETKKVVENILGIPIHYYAVVSFTLFKETINTLGGIEINIDNSFTDYYYPIEGKENAPENGRYETVHFDAGLQKLNGDTALKYVRSRKGDSNEGTDFARSKRQQNVITAIKGKVFSAETLLNPVKIKDLYDTYARNVDTDITFGDIQSFYLLTKEINVKKVKSVVLDDRSAANDGGLLYAPTDTSLYGGSYVLIPRTGDFSQIHAYVQKYLFGDS